MVEPASGRDRRSMAKPWAPLVLALVPWATHLASLEATSALTGRGIEPAELVPVAAAYLPFTALPSWVALQATRPGWLRLGVLLALAVAAGWAGQEQITSESSTAGLAVLMVPYVALPTAAAVLVLRAIRSTLDQGRR
jgi:hypothetical protein